MDIQALRAFAVMSVIVFHFWPNILPGGFIGVDVFFVISGYLITLHLIRSVESTGRIELAKFWSRRARRLLPASFLVLLVSAAITFMFLDAQDRYVHLRSIFGSALYIENWLLAFDSVDYLAAENNPSIAQHYWSLGVEEQFYLFWPVMLGFCAYQLRHYTNKIEIIKLITIGVFICSLSLCIIVTDIKQPFGFFRARPECGNLLPELTLPSHDQAGGLAAFGVWLRLGHGVDWPFAPSCTGISPFQAGRQ